MKLLLIIICVFIIGFKAGRFDALHGEEFGAKWGKATREYLVKHGYIKERT